MIKTIIFDLGGVIVTIGQPRAVERFAALGLKDAAQLLNPYTQAGPFGDLEEGKITADDFRREMSRLAGHNVTHEACRHAWMGYMTDLPGRNLDKLCRLRAQGYRLVLLSNTNPFIAEWTDSRDFDGQGHPIQHYFDALYRSFEVGMMKPEPRFFAHVLEAERLRPEQALFVDDGPRNVEAASLLGIHTLCPENGADWTTDIDRCLARF